jgi:uncharacterized protein involved in exopolysaccharide biosynthesis
MQDPWVTVAVAVITGLVTMVGTLAAAIVTIRNSHQAEQAQIVTQYHQLLEDLRTEVERLKQRVAELEQCLRNSRHGEGQPA